MKKTLGVIFLMLFLSAAAVSEEIASLEEIARPSMFLVKKGNIYILEKFRIYIYDLADFSLKKRFGKAGEGPEEFRYNARQRRPLSMCIRGDKLVVNSPLKLTTFDLNGQYLGEEKVKLDRLLFPCNDKYVGIGPSRSGGSPKRYFSYTLHSGDFTDNKTLYVSDFEAGSPERIYLPVSSFTYDPVYKDRIFIISDSGNFHIQVLNPLGEKIYTIRKDYPKIKITDHFRAETLDFFKRNPGFKDSYEYFKKVIRIRDYYPPIRDLQVVDDTLFILTFKRRGDLWECLQLDLKGHEKGRTFIRLNTYEPFSLYPILYSAYKNHIYTLVEDEDDEVWKIHRFPLGE